MTIDQQVHLKDQLGPKSGAVVPGFQPYEPFAALIELRLTIMMK